MALYSKWMAVVSADAITTGLLCYMFCIRPEDCMDSVVYAALLLRMSILFIILMFHIYCECL